MNKMKILKNLFKVVVFAVIFAVLLSGVTSLLACGMDRMSYNSVQGFQEEPEDTLDAVYIGSSNVLAFWNPMMAWEEYGIAVSTLATNSQPLTSAEFMIEEARKTQPNAKYIININTLGEITSVPRMHKVFSYLPFSMNKYNNVNRISDLYGFTDEEKMEFYFPIIGFHSRWNELVPADFKGKSNGFNGAIASPNYLGVSVDVSKGYTITENSTPLTETVETGLISLLDYCDKEKLEVLFITVPQSKDEENAGRYNTVNGMIKDRGYTVLDLMDKTEELGIFTDKDYYNRDHTNIHGSLKYTYYLAEYLIENHGFEDKRGNEAYSSWDEGLADYLKVIDSAVLDFQTNADYDPTSLDEPQALTADADKEQITVSWQAVEGADGYEIYEKSGANGKWKVIGETSELVFEDTEFASKGKYFYRVVPFAEKDGKKAYGNFSYSGAFVTAKKTD